jgi:predicted NUDIX family NTP pyrophosphohydrolase
MKGKSVLRIGIPLMNNAVFSLKRIGGNDSICNQGINCDIPSRFLRSESGRNTISSGTGEAEFRRALMAKHSAGILLYRKKGHSLEVFLVHPGGPFWVKKDEGAWSIPKGEFEEENPRAAAQREFHEETGVYVEGKFLELSPQKQKGGKIVYAWAVEGDLDPDEVRSNTFEIEWPPRSGKKQEFPEIDKGQWFTVQLAIKKINQGQAGLIRELTEKLDLESKKL